MAMPAPAPDIGSYWLARPSGTRARLWTHVRVWSALPMGIFEALDRLGGHLPGLRRRVVPAARFV
jgi:hypothetical protein